MADFILALDQGTTSSRALIFNREGTVVGWAQQEFPQIYPQPGWVSHNPEAIWESQQATARAALTHAKLQASDIAAIGITNQRETTVVWDRTTGRPIGDAVVWQCRRTAPMIDKLKERGLAESFRQKTGLVLDAYFSGTKIAWLLDNIPDARTKAEAGELAFGTVDSFLLWRLTGGRVHATDVSNASRTLIFNIHTLDWDDELLAELNIPRSILPDVRPSSSKFGTASADFVGAEIPITGIAGDQQAATFGQACFQPGMAKNTYGTGCFLLMNTGAEAVPSERGLLTTIGWQLDDGAPVTYALEGSVFIAGAAIQWLRDELGIIAQAAEVEALAEQVPDSGGVYFVPAFVGLGAPYWDQYARGTIVGLTRGSGRAQLARATLEAICYQTRDVLDAMCADSGIQLEALRVDGGAVVNNLLMQLQANFLGTPVERPAVTETTALGAAYLAGLKVGIWESLDEIAQQWKRDRRFEPAFSEDDRAAAYAGWQQAVAKARS